MLNPGGRREMDRPTRIRRLRYLSRRRSTLELDRMLGSVFDRLPWDEIDDEALAGLERIIELDDMTLQKALMGLAPVPPEARADLWAMMIARLGP